MKLLSNKYFKLIISLVFFALLYWQINNKFSFDEFNLIKGRSYIEYSLTTIFIIALMILNLSLESIKWKLAINSTNISFLKSFKSIFLGIAFGVFTPYRLGDFVGRLFLINEKYHNDAVFSNIIGSLFQGFITFILGIIVIFHNKYFTPPIYVFVFPLIFIVLIFYPSILPNKYFLCKAKYYLKKIKFSLKIKLFIISLLRYCTFTIQLITVLNFLGFFDYYKAIQIIISYYFIISFIPSFLWSEIGIRASVIGLLSSFFLVKSEVFMLSASLIWFVNLIIPSIIGYYIFNHTKRKVGN